MWNSLFSRVALFRENIFPSPFRRGGWGGRKKGNWKKCDLESAVAETRIPRKFLSFWTRLMMDCVSRTAEQFKDWYVLWEPSLRKILCLLIPFTTSSENYTTYPSECVMLSGGGKTKVRLRLGEREQRIDWKTMLWKQFVKKRADPERFFGIREWWPGLGISKQHGGKIGEAGAENHLRDYGIEQKFWSGWRY